MAIQPIKDKKKAEIEMLLMNKNIDDLTRSIEDLQPNKDNKLFALDNIQTLILEDDMDLEDLYED